MMTNLIDHSAIAWSEAGPGTSVVHGDHLRLFVTQGGRNYASQPIPASVVKQRVDEIQFECRVLVEVASSLRRDKQFQEAYVNHLLGGSTDDEWAIESMGFASELRPWSAGDLASRISVVEKWLAEWNVTVEEFSDLFNTTPEMVEDAVQTSVAPDTFGLHVQGGVWGTVALPLKGKESR